MPLADHGLRWVHPEVCLAHPLPDGTALALHRELEPTVASLETQAPGDGRAWARLIAPYLREFAAASEILLGAFPPAGGVVHLTARAGVGASARLALLAATPARTLARRLFAGDGSRALLLGLAAHGDAAVNRPGSSLPAFYLGLLAHAAGWPSPRGGAQALTDALVAHLRSLGGAVVCGAAVARIECRGGRVTGVLLGDGTRHGAEIVVADVSAHGLLELTGAELSGCYRLWLSRFRPGPPALKLDWALAAPIPWSAPEARAAGTVHLCGERAGPLASLPPTVRSETGRPFVLLGQQSIADPTRAPAGRHTAWAYTRAHAFDCSPAAVVRLAEAVEEEVERFAPGFRAAILARHVLTPRELEARNRNLTGGDVGGGSYSGLQSLLRPLPSRCPYRTPIEGLYLGSASTFPGGGVHGVPGDAAAAVALRDAKRRRVRRETKAKV